MKSSSKDIRESNGIGTVRERVRRIFSKWSVWQRLGHCRQFIQDGEGDDWRSSDQAQNDRVRLPDDEVVQIPVITIVELYTPSQINGLLKGIRGLGWEHGRTRSDDLLKWANEVRQGRSAGSINLGLVGAKGAKHYLMQERTADLPVGVRAAFPTLMTLTPSITAMVMSFILDDEFAARINKPLHHSYATHVETHSSFRWWNIISYVLFGGDIKFSRTIHNPMNQQRNAVALCIDVQEDACARWVRESLPGIFSSGIRGKPLPSAILFVTEKTEFSSEATRYHAAFDGIGLNNFFDAWRSDEWPSVRLFLSRSWDDASMRLTFACSRKNAFPINAMYREPESNWTIAYRTHEKIAQLAVRWALSCLLDGYHEQLSELRDQSAIDHSHRTVRDLKRLRHLVRTKFYDIVTSAHDADDFAQSDSDFCFDVLNFENVESAKRGQKFYLLNALRSGQRSRAQQLLREANLLQSLLSVSSDLSQTITNIKIQRSIIALTIISVVIGAVTLWETIHPVH